MNKRFLCALLALMMVLTMAACRGKTEEPTQPEATEPTAAQDEIAVTDPTEEATEPFTPTYPDQVVEENTTEVTQPDPTEETLPGEENSDLDEDDTPSTPGSSQQPSSGSNGGVEVPGSAGGVTYEMYNAMSGDQQLAFINQFASVEEFVKWYNAAKDKYEQEHPDIEIDGDTVIDGSQLMGG